MATVQGPTIGTRNLARDPRLTVRLLRQRPDDINNLPNPMTPNELVGVYNGITNSVKLYVVSGDGFSLIPVLA